MQRWDIFCRIVDNYGDIGVCWRLARQLADEYNLAVRLCVDEPGVAQRLIPGLYTAQAKQTIADVQICHWTENFSDTDVADVVIEAFACELPQPYLQAMVQTRPLWLNLEYLSAEDWVGDFHAQASLHPSLGLTKYFFFPGFTTETGGLLRERGLVEQRNAFQGSLQAQQDFWQQLGVDTSGGLVLSLFCYPQAPIPGLLASLAGSERPVLCLAADGGALPLIADYLGVSKLKPGDKLSKGNLRMQVLPFLAQQDYDRLLWACDLNFVRGEDSWVRALWAAKPLVWQPYRQAENTHLAKLHAFIAHYCADLTSPAQQALAAAHANWSNGSFSPVDWQALQRYLPELQAHARSQAERLSNQLDLAAKLVIFSKNLF